jgi:hypothetical protein
MGKGEGENMARAALILGLAGAVLFGLLNVATLAGL